MQLGYFGNELGKKGSLRSKSYGRYSATYDYDNGVVKSATFAAGPPINRIINPNGTIQSETRSGVTIGYAWDNDFRLRNIDYPEVGQSGPEADATISYSQTVATMTRGEQELRLTVDAWGRLIERRETVQSSPLVDATKTYAQFDAKDRP